ncbi:DUF4097 family beta strand repeat-containing protein [Nocardioides bizhenqiangii]|uniref:DUF4097 family beta strand repeat-containing protein n=1 Tax=Nocardioides bizhenqiangii TaxID=3095076 RepID=A0ABZ0ZPN7_9ACTN|nr:MULTISPECIES: DUF4097 family beta strand repeat-containing protein [unclassified Nocardioides]MDZ5619816.1 DUF4097 family beta strand repeat-containing protein [Nocardioides sp. HM23]WQQ26178.1 DUF4097 family beta strand repeat-containing protein [Nocardioides sp. HM61]
MPEHRFDTPEPVQLYVENGSGHIDVTAADVTETEVRIEGRHADQVEVVHDRGQVSVIAPKSRGLFGDQKLAMDIVVPSDSSVVLKSGSADVRVSGTVATAKVKSGSGDVSLEQVTGSGSIDTGSGDVALTAAEGELRVRSGSGDVFAARLGAATTVSSGSGDIRIEHAAGPVVVKTGSGDLDIAHAGDDVMMTTGSGDTVIRAATRGKITSKGASGDIRIGVPAGTPVWTDITTVSGTVSSGLEGVGEPEPGSDYIEVRASTVSGDIHLVPA